jgi:hypothetical protein
MRRTADREPLASTGLVPVIPIGSCDDLKERDGRDKPALTKKHPDRLLQDACHDRRLYL